MATSSNGREAKEDPGIAGALSPPPFEETALAKLAGEVEPRRPLRRPLERALFLLLVAGGLAAAALAMTSLRSDLGEASWAVTYGPAVTEMLAGLSYDEVERLFITGSDVPYAGGGGHYNREGNELVARWLHDRLATIPTVAAALQRAQQMASADAASRRR